MRSLLAIIALLLSSALLPGQEKAATRLPFRVISAGPEGTAVIDRGRRDGVLVGDVGEVLPRGGRTYRLVVRRIEDRSATVELDDKAFRPEPGMRGELIQPLRVTQPADPPSPPPIRPDPSVQPDAQDPERAPVRWRNPDQEWEPGMPLLTKVPPQRPKDRKSIFVGRLFSTGTLTRNTDESFQDSFIRLGADMTYSNVGGSGGELRFYGEFDYLTEQNDQVDPDLLLQRLSYSIGGNRWTPHRFEIGRFLHREMPEFGVIDGIDYNFRQQNGNVFGLSAGFLPELDEDFDTGDDAALTAFYLWRPERDDVLEYGVGYQKSFHNGATDRDLFVFKLRRIPIEGWTVHSTLWVDYYYGSDELKGTGPDVTQAYVSVGRRFEDGAFDLIYRHQEFPEIQRNGEFLPILAFDLERNRFDSVTLRGWSWSDEETRWEGNITGWSDEDAIGGNVEVGVDIEPRDDEAWRGISLFALNDDFATGGGARLRYGSPASLGRWDLFYELAWYRWQGFTAEGDDLWQHRLRASRSFYTESGWDASIYGEGQWFDDELSVILGFYVQRRF